VKSVDFNVADKRLDIEVDFERGSHFPGPPLAAPLVKCMIQWQNNGGI